MNHPGPHLAFHSEVLVFFRANISHSIYSLRHVVAKSAMLVIKFDYIRPVPPRRCSYTTQGVQS
jgi:hypothetical protein